ncbi:hypothetical protein CI610_00854 [invertebrate metagenome]|uniref:Urease accessory protein UreH-like transmembrane domain-containing protein n=1 Tax=invertebrate metagenome TaxID=1711999 RepID=A0A2H9TA95_9ZZZZ
MQSLSVCLSALLLGLLGSSHCIGMCGGVASALSVSLPTANRRKNLFLLAGYHIGRIASYSIAGLLLGGIGFFLGDINPAVKIAFRFIAAIMLILMGFYLSGWWRVLVKLEHFGQKLWSRLQPLSKRYLPVDNLKKALAIGLLWGWLPCGLVYSTLIWAASQGNPVMSAVLMLCFGVGTIPALLLTGLLSQQLTRFLQARMTRNTIAVLLILFGLWTLPGSHQKWLMMTLSSFLS